MNDWLTDCVVQVNPSIVEQLENSGMLFVGHDDDGKRMEIMELQGIYVSLLICIPDIVFRSVAERDCTHCAHVAGSFCMNINSFLTTMQQFYMLHY